MADGTSVDSTTRTQPKAPPPPPPPPPPKADPVKEAGARDDKVTADAAAIESQGREARALLDKQVKDKEPVMPAGGTEAPADKAPGESRPLAHDPRTGPPEAQVTAKDALTSAVSGPERHALAAEIAARAGLPPPRDTPANHDVKRRAEETAQRLIEAGKKTEKLADGTDPNSERVQQRLRTAFDADRLGISQAEIGKLRDPTTREATAREIGKREAEQRAMEKTFGGPENVKRAEAAWASASAGERKQMADRASDKVRAAAEAAGAPARALAGLIPGKDAVEKLAEGDVAGAAKSAAVDAALTAGAFGVGKLAAAALPAVKGAFQAGVDKVKGLFRKSDDAARKGDADAAVRQSPIGKEGLARQLANEQQVAQLKAGKGEVIAGAGSPAELRAAETLAKKYGGKPEDWQKVRSSSATDPDGLTHREIHAYQRRDRPGELFEMKTKETHGPLAARGIESMGDLLKRAREIFPGF